MLRLLGFLLLFTLVVLGLSFAVLNAQTVQLNYYLGTIEVPVSLALVSALAGGAVLGVLVSLGMLIGQKRRLAQLEKKVQIAEKEVSNLRAIPLKDTR